MFSLFYLMSTLRDPIQGKDILIAYSGTFGWNMSGKHFAESNSDRRTGKLTDDSINQFFGRLFQLYLVLNTV